ncbi:Collectin-12 [Desmophyllum pertusum]|uniref:Collectin-12 n=1 Tax=Desmophyllum pertusum TaxID=174260 RepID=A0A9X0CKF8_9CNID|nr:Collectin-12 [Desmophyllum pertusum]
MTCEEMDGSLVILNSLEEYEFLYTEVLPYKKYQVWIGLREIGSSKPRIWKWVDGSVPAFTKWGLAQPQGSDAHCVTLLNGSFGDGKWNHVWNDRICSTTQDFVCETKQKQPH